MIRYFLFCCLLISSYSFFAQKTNYFDSLKLSFISLSETQQIDAILDIPFDKMTSNFYEAGKLYNRALQLTSKIDNIEKKADVHDAIAKSFYYQGKYDESLKHNLQAIHYYEEIGNDVKAGSSYASLGYQMKRRNLLKAFQYMQKGINLLQQSSDKKALSAAYNNYGVLHEMNNHIDSALYYYRLGLDIVQSFKDSIGIPYSLNNIAGALMIKSDFSNALLYYDKAFKIRQKRNDVNGLLENYVYYGDFFFKQNNFKKAIDNYLIALEKAEQTKYTYLLQVVSSQLAICYEKIGKFDLALTYQKQQQLFKDSLLNEKTNNTIAQLEVQFETEKKEKEIAKQTLKIKQRNYFLMGMFGLVVFIIAISFFIYKQQKLKQQKLEEENRLKDELSKAHLQNKLHEERLRISRDLHDNIGSQLTFIISSVDNMKFLFKSSDGKLKDKLTNVSHFTRTTITQLRDTIWAMNKGEILLEDLQIRLFNYVENAKLTQKNIQFNFNVNTKSDTKLNSVEGINIFRIVQEAINNSIKYAVASKIDFCVIENKEKLEIQISDDGVGFNMNKITLGNGLNNMHQRAKEIKATLVINSSEKKGTTIVLGLNKDRSNAV